MAQQSTTFLSTASARPPWPGTSRYRVRKVLGQGGMGIVYEAFDKERGQAVAVKTLPRFDAAALYLLKQEFRTLADVRHRNLVRLYELVIPEQGQAFFSMELVRGVNFKAYVRSPEKERRDTRPSVHPMDRETVRPRRGGADPVARHRTPSDVGLLRAALRELVLGVHALHSAGKLHRDIKPSNILVADGGRVVLLDFGVAAELSEIDKSSPSGEVEIVGTATYMAPEQGLDGAQSPASDWYSVGVVLYEALVGRPPFAGSAVDVLTMKATLDPAPPSACAEDVPADLDALCMALLSREPAARPTGAQILRQLGIGATLPPVAGLLRPAAAASVVGRETHMLALREAFDVVRSGRTAAVHLSGGPGMGKSTLALAFLDELSRAGEVLILRSRAYVRESVPYKAIDAAIDALSRHLARLAETGSLPPLPADIWALARVFPVLQRLPMDAPDGAAIDDPQIARRCALQALTQLLALLAERQTIVLFIDDAQWGDAESAALLLELVRSPDAPPLLLLMTHRSEASSSPFLTELRDHWPDRLLARDVDVGPLSFDDTLCLALALLGGSDASRTARAVARESRGSPFLVEELVRENRGSHTREGPGLSVLTLDQMVSERMGRLTPSARALLELVAVAGRPMLVSVVAEAAEARSVEDDVALCVARRLLRAGLRDGRDIVEIAHDRIREIIVAQLSDATTRDDHARLGRALQAASDGDAEAIAMHWLAAGDRERAAEFAERAAEQAASKLAFDHAGRLVQLAIDNMPPLAPAVRRLRLRLGTLLKHGGHAIESARVFLSLLDGSTKEESIEYQRLASEQLLAAGCMEEGTELLHRVLDAAGLKVPRTPIAAIFWLLVYRLWLRLLGLRIRERKAQEVPVDARARIEALYTATSGFSIVDVVLSACMQARHLIEALRYGDRLQLLRAVSHEAAHLAAAGGPQRRRERRLFEIAKQLAEQEATKEAEAHCFGASGIGSFQRGRFREAENDLRRAEKATLKAVAGTSSVRMFSVYAGFYSGYVEECRKRLARLCADAENRGDKYTLVNVNTSVAVHAALSLDDVDGARRVSREALLQWTQKGFHVQHWQAMVYGPDAEVYSGNGAAAYEQFGRGLPALGRSLLMHAGFIRAMTSFCRARYAIASIEQRPAAREQRVEEALDMAERLSRESDRWTMGLAAMVRAIAYNAGGDRSRAIDALRRAAEHTQASACLVYNAPVLYRLGQLLGGREGEAMRRGAHDAMLARGIRNPDRWTRMYLPGVWPERVEANA
jgi:hypothetical protein